MEEMKSVRQLLLGRWQAAIDTPGVLRGPIKDFQREPLPGKLGLFRQFNPAHAINVSAAALWPSSIDPICLLL